MLKLKYLFDNRELAIMLLKNWHYDEASLSLFDHYRISSNAIYPFKYQEKLYFLRFVPEIEKDIENIQEEIKVISLLALNEFNVPRIIKSKSGNSIETKETPWGTYHAVVFESVGNKTLENIQITDKIAYKYGSSLARFHKISKETLQSNVRRESIYELLDRIEMETMNDVSVPSAFKRQVKHLQTEFENIKDLSYEFGLIHFDYELDNVLYDDATDELYVIDFDDCMFGFFGQDVERAINSIDAEVDEEIQDTIKSAFLNGYADAGGALKSYYDNRELFKSFADLYAYIRMKRSLDEKWENEPLWMETLRLRLSERMKRYIGALKL